ncbi:hypothetical protein [Microbacterium sp.]|uniref:hypothetical protein n=1 Tax=Microbacterium sp. TaxID=51671 RepID=UPI0025EB462A|nr:hypothetical protein [Microbacterium sp.]
MARRRIGAYILPGDPNWLAKTLVAYYPLLEELVVPLPAEGIGWAGRPIPVDDVLAIVRTLDHRGILRTLEGTWTDLEQPMRADTAQRQAALDALAGRVDWVLQIDNDEYLPNPAALLQAIDAAEDSGLSAVEWPMRVLFRRTKRWVFEVVSEDGSSRYDYPGAIAVKPEVVLADARRADAPFLRALVIGDDRSLQVRRPATEGEQRWEELRPEDAIIHNSWARSAGAVWQKTRSWGHVDGMRSVAYFVFRWMPVPLLWQFTKNLHPFARDLWPRLARRSPSPDLTDRAG